MYLRPDVRNLLTGIAALGLAASLLAAPPQTRVDPVSDTLHGRQIVDPYRWLEDGDSEEVSAWTDAQNAYTRAYLDQFAEQRAALKQRLAQLYAAATVSQPRIAGERYFYFRQEGGQNQPVLYTKTRLDGDERVVINPNEWSADGAVAIDWWHPSPDGRLIAYGRSEDGSEMSTLHLRDVAAAADTALTIPRTRACTVAWDADGRGFSYVQYPAPGQVAPQLERTTRWIRRHRFGSALDADPIVFGQDSPPNTWHDVRSSADHRWRFIEASLDWTRNDLYMRPNTPDGELRPVAVSLDGLFSAEVVGDKLLLLTNWQAPRYRVLVTDVDNPSQANWTELIGQQEGVIESMTIAGGRIVLGVLENAAARLLVYDLDGRRLGEIDLPTLGSVTAVAARHDRPELLFTFESFAYPPALLRCDLDTAGAGEQAAGSASAARLAATVVEQTPLDVPPDRYETQQVWFTSRDGTRVPMFIVHRRGLDRDRRRPTILYGYGGFGVNVVPRFRRDLFAWLDAGGVYASANLRGGGEFGSAWHHAGRLAHKQNVFDDFIAAAEKLIADGYTDSAHLGILGGSNGGLLVGAAITQRPELFGAAYCAVPLLDMLRYHKFLIGSLWVPEYGSADDPEQLAWLAAYSPYHQVRDGTPYPAVLLTAAESDTRVDPLHARKMAARLQAATSGDQPILLWVERKAGHGAGKPLDMFIDTKVDQWMFFQRQLGVIAD